MVLLGGVKLLVSISDPPGASRGNVRRSIRVAAARWPAAPVGPAPAWPEACCIQDPGRGREDVTRRHPHTCSPTASPGDKGGKKDRRGAREADGGKGGTAWEEQRKGEKGSEEGKTRLRFLSEKHTCVMLAHHYLVVLRKRGTLKCEKCPLNAATWSQRVLPLRPQTTLRGRGPAGGCRSAKGRTQGPRVPGKAPRASVRRPTCHQAAPPERGHTWPTCRHHAVQPQPGQQARDAGGSARPQSACERHARATCIRRHRRGPRDSSRNSATALGAWERVPDPGGPRTRGTSAPRDSVLGRALRSGLGWVAVPRTRLGSWSLLKGYL